MYGGHVVALVMLAGEIFRDYSFGISQEDIQGKMLVDGFKHAG
jgi:hypothetical protein